MCLCVRERHTEREKKDSSKSLMHDRVLSLVLGIPSSISEDNGVAYLYSKGVTRFSESQGRGQEPEENEEEVCSHHELWKMDLR